VHPCGAVARRERAPGLVLLARGDGGEVAWVGGNAGEDLRQNIEWGVGLPVLDRPVDRERRGAAARGVRG